MRCSGELSTSWIVRDGTVLADIDAKLTNYLQSEGYVVGNKANHEIISKDTVVNRDIDLVIMKQNIIIIELDSLDDKTTVDDIASEISTLTGINVDNIIVTIIRDEKDNSAVVKVYVQDENSAEVTAEKIKDTKGDECILCRHKNVRVETESKSLVAESASRNGVLLTFLPLCYLVAILMF